MASVLKNRRTRLLLVYVLLDSFCVAMGMGVPVFCIAFGFIVGWYLSRHIVPDHPEWRRALRSILRDATLAAFVTFAIMLVLWGGMTILLFDRSADLSRTGIPLILYQPRASLIGWLVLMILVSPFLQLLTTIFGAHVTLIRRQRGSLDAT